MNLFFQNLIEPAATIFENFIILELMGKVFGYKFAGVKKQLCFYLTLAISTAYVTFLNAFMLFEGWFVLVTIGIFIAYGVLCLNGKAFKKALMPIILFTILICINISATYIFSSLFGEHYTEFMSPDSSWRLLTLFITKFAFFIFSRIILYALKRDEFELQKTELILISVLFILSNSIAIANFEIQIGENTDILSLISITSIIIINIFIFVMFRRISKENRNKLKISFLETQLSEQKIMLEDSGHLNKEIRKAEHDIKHHFTSILGCLEDKKYDDATNYIMNLLDEYETSSFFKYISIENSAVNSILNFKISRCRVCGIDIKIEIESNFEKFDDIDICVLLSNLLDNAIEASVEIPAEVHNLPTDFVANKDEKQVKNEGTNTLEFVPQITLTIKEEKNYLRILVRNKINGSVLNSNSFLKTTKADKRNHGLGLYSVSQVVEKYDGMKKFYEENEFFTADIWLKKKLYVLAERIKSEVNYQT